MSQEFINPSDGVIRQYLATSKTLAVVGESGCGKSTLGSSIDDDRRTDRR